MAFLGRARKADLVTMIDELGLTLPINVKVAQLCKVIVESKDYDEEFTKNLLSTIIAERENSERVEAERVAMAEKFEKERLERIEDREFELKKLQMELEAKKSNGAESFSKNRGKDLIKLMTNFESKDDISIYLALFERQISRAEIPKESWVSYLVGLLPLEMVNLITREEDTIANDYEEVKKLLLTRFRLHYEQFRQKFVTHKKETSASWRDFAFEVNRFFEEWIKGLEIASLDDLKELIVTDQIKRKIPHDIREHLVDELPKIKKINDLVIKLEEHEMARNNLRKQSGRETSNATDKSNRQWGKNTERAHVPTPTHKGYNKFGIKCYSCSEMGHKSVFCPKRKETIRCAKCRSFAHKTENCMQTQKESSGTFVSNAQNSMGKVHKVIGIGGKKFNSMVDTGSDLTLTSREVYLEIGSPPLERDDIVLSGISGDKISPFGFFTGEITIDDYKVTTNIYVLEKLCKSLILGMDVIGKLDVLLTQDGITVLRKRETLSGEGVIAEIQKPDPAKARDLIPDNLGLREERKQEAPEEAEMGRERVLGEIEENFLTGFVDVVNTDEIDLAHIVNKRIKGEIIKLVRDYKPNKIKDSEPKMNIILSDEAPVSQRPRRMAFAEQQIVHTQVQEWLDNGIVKMSTSDFAAPVVLCRKKDGTHRMCIDFRKLNKKIIKERFPLPLIEDVLDHLEQNKVFTALDLKNGFFHVNVEEKSSKYTAFVTHEGQFEFLKMPFGLCNSPSVFQRFVHNIFRDLINDKTVMIYIDDMIIAAENEEEGLEKLKRVLKRASEHGLELKFPKCQFLKRQIEYLGYLIENGTIRPSPGKTAAVQKFPLPKNTKQVQSFLGLTGYFRKFIPQYSKVAKPLSDLLRDNAKFQIGPEQLEAFKKLKDELSSSPVLHIYRQGSELELHTDASSHGFGAVLLQKEGNGKFYPLHYWSKKTSPQQEKYNSYELEVLAIVEALKKFRNYLLGTKFKIVTDCDAFLRTLNKKELAPKVARWALLLEEFNYEVIHRPGKQMQHVDALSRNTVLLIARSHDEVTSRILTAQDKDEQIASIKSLVQKGEGSGYLIKNNILYKVVNGRELLVIPKAMQTEIILKAHNKGHFAAAKTEEVLKQDFYFTKMKEVVEGVIANCVECILCNRKRGKGEGLLNPIPKESIPLSTYHVDFIGPLPSTSKKYQHIFTVIDAFTKFTWFYPSKSTTAHEAIDKLKLQQNVFGNPARIITDKGAAFNSKDFKDYCQEQGVEHVQITTGIPRGNGQIERIHETIIPVLAKLSIDDPTKWFRYVADVQRILNSTIARSTKFTPFELMVGVKMRNPEDQRITEILEEEYLNNTMQDRVQLREEAKANILKIQQENRQQFNRKRKKARVYKVGDLVAIKRTQFGTGLKLRVKFFGPYRITDVKHNDRYNVKKIGEHEGPGLTSSAADHMKPWSNRLS